MKETTQDSVKTGEDRVQPMFVEDNDAEKRYELDFSRDSIRFAERREFKIDEVTTYPQTSIPDLFFYAFRKNHRDMARSQTDALLDKMGGLTSAALERLILLYQQAALSNVVATNEEAEKNTRVTVEL